MASDNQAEFGKRLAKVMKKMKDQSAKDDAARRANYVPAEEQEGVVNPDPDLHHSMRSQRMLVLYKSL